MMARALPAGRGQVAFGLLGFGLLATVVALGHRRAPALEFGSCYRGMMARGASTTTREGMGKHHLLVGGSAIARRSLAAAGGMSVVEGVHVNLQAAGSR